MVLNSSLVAVVANLSAEACQYIACNPQRLPSQQALHLIFCFPLNHLRRLFFCLSSVFCCFPSNPYLSSSDSFAGSDSDSNSDTDFYDSHSD